MSDRERLARRAAGGDALAARRLADMLSGRQTEVWLALEYGPAEDERAGYTGEEYQLAEILGVFSSKFDALLACLTEALDRSLTRSQRPCVERVLEDLEAGRIDMDPVGEFEAALVTWNELVPDRYRLRFLVEPRAVDAEDPREAVRKKLDARRPRPLTDPPWPRRP